jgi:hypothetical protein
LVSERPKPKQGKLVDKTPGATIKHTAHKCGYDTLTVNDWQQLGTHKSGKGVNYT